MKNVALIAPDGTVENVIVVDEGEVHPQRAYKPPPGRQTVDVPADVPVEVGAKWDGKKFTPKPPPPVDTDLARFEEIRAKAVAGANLTPAEQADAVRLGLKLGRI